MNEFNLDFPRALGAPEVSAGFRVECEDFVVNEVLGFEPSNDGEHQLLEVIKRDDNTPWVAKQIAQIAGVKPMDVGYCGMKDRRAVTRQWFSVYLPKAQPLDWQALNTETTQLVRVARHHKKLRRGEHQANEFLIRLRDCQGDLAGVEQRLARIAEQGVPNYFGEQRFGRNASNLIAAEQAFAQAASEPEGARPRRSRKKGGRRPAAQGGAGMSVSAARSWLFNQVLAARVNASQWREPMAGEPNPEPSGPLWGRGRNPAGEALLALEDSVLTPWRNWCNSLEHAGLSQERRALCLQPQALRWHFEGQDLCLAFTLAPGQFATAVLREIAVLITPELAAE
ncbi:tRNA pseudouridine(13) synthase TruD [Simiduia sp. 21SJ11W-1]|uniref:tRNA pseudouridine(13) synthase TruD n=1 Tax=Simiduia sp. 21SJ11W-1 TaxID=2909669 RepID=UPI0020A22C98|nr:tRNA pseudouridine(13) synthase TruD [Simiduia sp. 21SJ11W-1]UTA49148.1 tRNA pseudouridine(13) synthase TruD [Simiduia sp. 21SJ11W-1]